MDHLVDGARVVELDADDVGKQERLSTGGPASGR
jgi:hypothetical protein